MTLWKAKTKMLDYLSKPDGVLALHLPKAEKTEAKKIEIQ